jgi:hypothetical protein
MPRKLRSQSAHSVWSLLLQHRPTRRVPRRVPGHRSQWLQASARAHRWQVMRRPHTKGATALTRRRAARALRAAHAVVHLAVCHRHVLIGLLATAAAAGDDAAGRCADAADHRLRALPIGNLPTTAHADATKPTQSHTAEVTRGQSTWNGREATGTAAEGEAGQHGKASVMVPHTAAAQTHHVIQVCLLATRCRLA